MQTANKYWKQENDIYYLYFQPFDDADVILTFSQDKSDPKYYIYSSTLLSCTDEYLKADSVEKAMSEFEDMIKEHFEEEAQYQQTLLKLFTEE